MDDDSLHCEKKIVEESQKDNNNNSNLFDLIHSTPHKPQLENSTKNILSIYKTPNVEPVKFMEGSIIYTLFYLSNSSYRHSQVPIQGQNGIKQTCNQNSLSCDKKVTLGKSENETSELNSGHENKKIVYDASGIIDSQGQESKRGKRVKKDAESHRDYGKTLEEAIDEQIRWHDKQEEICSSPKLVHSSAERKGITGVPKMAATLIRRPYQSLYSDERTFDLFFNLTDEQKFEIKDSDFEEPFFEFHKKVYGVYQSIPIPPSVRTSYFTYINFLTGLLTIKLNHLL